MFWKEFLYRYFMPLSSPRSEKPRTNAPSVGGGFAGVGGGFAGVFMA